jgi:hypothetical protein
MKIFILACSIIGLGVWAYNSDDMLPVWILLLVGAIWALPILKIVILAPFAILAGLLGLDNDVDIGG